jgi:hypothetical protein
MLELRDQERELVANVGPLKCDLRFPDAWKDRFDQTGPLPSRYSDRRRYVRYHFRVWAALEHRQTFPALPRPRGWHKILTIDLSRGGLSFLHSEPLFPRERMQFVLPGQLARIVEVVWFTRIQDRCFHVGGRFVEQAHGLDFDDGDAAVRPDAFGSFDGCETEG